jgi:putative flippase GtrA
MRPHPSHLYSVPAYIGVGGIATAAHYVTMFALVQSGLARPLIGTITGFCIGAIVKYALSYTVTFRSTGRHVEAGPRFVAVLAILFAANAGIFWVLNSVLGLNYMLAQVITTISLIAPGYVANRRWVFLRC